MTPRKPAGSDQTIRSEGRMNWRKLACLWLAWVIEATGTNVHVVKLLREIELPIIDGGGFNLVYRRGSRVAISAEFQSLPDVSPLSLDRDDEHPGLWLVFFADFLKLKRKAVTVYQIEIGRPEIEQPCGREPRW